MQERATALGGEFAAGPTPRRLAGALRASGGRRGKPVIRAAIVDDQAIVRAGLARILSPADGFEVVAECADGRQAVEELPALRPDVVLMDVRMPALDGIAATAQLRAPRRPARRARAHDVRRGRSPVGRDRGRRCRLRAQGLLGRGSDRGRPGGRRRRGLVRPGGRAASARPLQAASSPRLPATPPGSTC